MVQEKPPISLRIALLEQTLLSGNTAALDAFWQEVEEHGTPLIEAIEGDETYHLILRVSIRAFRRVRADPRHSKGSRSAYRV